MKIALIVGSDINQKTGYFNAVHLRIKNLMRQSEVVVYTLQSFDGILITFFKRLLKRNTIAIKGDRTFVYDMVTYNTLWSKKSLFSLILGKLSPILAIKYSLLKIPKSIALSDLIVAHWGSPHGVVATHIGQLNNIPSVVTYHGSDIHTLPLRSKQVFKCTEYALTNATLNLFVSKKLQEIAEGIFNDISFDADVSYNTTELIKKTENIVSLDAKNTKKVVGFVGNLLPIKRADKLSEIFREIYNLNNTISFLVVGDGECRTVIEEECCKFGLKVIFTDKIPPNEVPAQIQQMNLLILPSRNEGLPLVLLEAIASGVRAIGSDVGGIKEVLGEFYVVAEGDEFKHRFALKVVEVLSKDFSQEIPSVFDNEISFNDEFDIYKLLINKLYETA